MSDREFDEYEPKDSSPESGLLETAQGIDTLAQRLLARPDWEQTQILYAAPIGALYTLELLSRTANESLKARVAARDGDTRYDARYLRIMTSEGVDCLKVNLNNFGRQNRLNYTIAFGILEASDTLDDVTGTLLRETIVGNMYSPIEEGLKNINRCYNQLLAMGTINQRYGIWHDLEGGAQVYFMMSEKHGSHTWKEIDNEPELHIRVKLGSGRTIDLMHYRDGSYETFDVDPDTGKVLRAIVGEENVLETDDALIEFNSGGNAAKKQAVTEAERAMGLRDLDPERLEIIQAALSRVADERPAN